MAAEPLVCVTAAAEVSHISVHDWPVEAASDPVECLLPAEVTAEWHRVCKLKDLLAALARED